MVLKRKFRPLLLCEICHSLPGRVRIKCRALRYLGKEAAQIKQSLENVRAIHRAQVSSLTENVLVHYDATQNTAEKIRGTVETIIASYSLIAYKMERKEKHEITVKERRLQEESISEIATRVAIIGVSLIFSMLRRPPLHAGFWRRFTTMPALTSISFALPIFKSGFESMRTTFRPNADTLSATAIFTSLLAGRSISALTIIWLADIAELLTAYTMERARRAIRDMLSVGEEYVWKISEQGPVKVRLEELRPDDRIMVNTGEKISVDGLVEEGDASVDQASITGEFMPMHKITGDRVFAGTVVKSGHITIRAEKVGDQTAVARIIHMVEDASHRKATIQAFADRFSAQFIPLNFALAAIVYAVTRSTTRALNMLIIDYSCGVRLSTATAFSAVICNAARQGILVKGGNYIELLAETDTLILDKTGTLTEGKPQVVTIVASRDVEPQNLVETAAAAEEMSTHPMALAVLNKIDGMGWQIPQHGETQVHQGRGVEARMTDCTVRVGSRRFMQEHGIDTQSIHEEVTRLVSRGENVIYVARDSDLLGALGIQDTLRENMKKALNRLRFTGLDDIILLTGDVEQQAQIIATRMAMDRYEAEVLPEHKAETVLRLQSKGIRVVMVGDGINDAPALAYADVGIAMGTTRTDIAMEAAAITIARDDPLMIPGVIQMARKTMRIVRQNFATAIGVNTVGLMLASLGVLPVFWAAVLHNSCTVAVVLNSARLLFLDTQRLER